MSISREIKQRVWDRDGDRCRYCSRQLVDGGEGYPPVRTVDHDVPTARGGTDDESNLVACCSPCNNQKGGRTGAEYLAWLESRR